MFFNKKYFDFYIFAQALINRFATSLSISHNEFNRRIVAFLVNIIDKLRVLGGISNKCLLVGPKFFLLANYSGKLQIPVPRILNKNHNTYDYHSL